VPSHKRFRTDQERSPRLSLKHPARCGQERLVGWAIDRPLDLTAQDADLVTQDGVLELRLSGDAPVRLEQAEDAAQEEIEERADQGAALSQIEPPLPVSAHDRVSGPHGSGGIAL
jgi:hypothetical protein